MWFADKIIKKHDVFFSLRCLHADKLHNLYKLDKRVIICQTIKNFVLFVKIFNQFGNKILGGLQQLSLV